MDEIGEAELSSAGRNGAAVDGSQQAHKRIVRAALLRKCCLELREQIDPRGLRLNNTIADGLLDLSGMTVPFQLRFHRCEFVSPHLVEGAQLSELWLTGNPDPAAMMMLRPDDVIKEVLDRRDDLAQHGS
jgi:hypothetical protein